LTPRVSEKFRWESVSRRTSLSDAADRDISSRFVAFSARTTSNGVERSRGGTNMRVIV
jgi:hypothetical protein